MKKALHVAWKDICIRVADRSAFIFLLLTPFVLTLILGAAFGGLGGGSSGPSAIPVAIVNLDDGELGAALVDVFASEDLSDLFDTQVKTTAAEARSAVDGENFAAAVIIPSGFTDAVMPSGFEPAQMMGMLSGGEFQFDTTNVAIYTNPTWSISANIVKAVVEAFAWQVSSGVVGGYISVEQLLASGKLQPAGIMAYVQAMTERLQAQGEDGFQPLIALRQETVSGEEAGSDTDWVIAYYAPSMAIMFLSFGVTFGARTILEEKRTGTLGRLLTTPTSAMSILGGKLSSTFVVGLLQFGVLLGASSALFDLDWGTPLAVAALSLALVAAMTSLGVALAGLVRSEEQVNTWGVAVLLVFSAVSGNFVPRIGFPTWLKTLGLFTPNAWALEGFTKLGTGGGLSDIRAELVALAVMAVVLFVGGVFGFRRRMAV
jgi:ABC-2 type transport system permease protein